MNARVRGNSLQAGAGGARGASAATHHLLQSFHEPPAVCAELVRLLGLLGRAQAGQLQERQVGVLLRDGGFQGLLPASKERGS